MKYLLSALLALCVFGNTPLVAGQGVKPMLKANVVVVQTPDSAVAALRKLAGVFVSQGYTVDKLDTQFLTLTLAPKIVPNRYNPVLAIQAVAGSGAASTLRITGEYKVTILGQPLAEIAQNTGANSSCSTLCFRELQKAATAYPSGKVGYAK